ncbi:hypothetical protein LX16_3818 [Stackebrandtia albiflava]|uniref:Uncharacterized protein n=1 Tax=Stackebrandtia albiflava TaxID=406432 RepID=A0A562V5A3_9ACTN|nr:hypothetical protein [Stackebrandtia albiflava]TWJ13050.1 hypothetical protein LX16_3818 [Stackebrandtia albiflava]
MRSRLLRPWPRTTLVAVTAIVAGLTAYLVAEARLGLDAVVDAQPAAVTPESWIDPLSEEDPFSTPELRELAAEVSDTEPSGDPVVVVQAEAMSPSLAVLPPGDYSVWGVCRSLDQPENTAFTVDVSVDGVEPPTGFDVICDLPVEDTGLRVTVSEPTPIRVSAYMSDMDTSLPEEGWGAFELVAAVHFLPG